MRSLCKISFAFLITSTSLVAAVRVSAQATPPAPPAHQLRFQSTNVPLPDELDPAIRAALAPKGLRATEKDVSYCDNWLRFSMPVAEQPDRSDGVMFGEIAQGTLVGAIKFTPAVNDYHNQQVQPGVYTLRYLLLPVDGNHQGKAPGRDFVVLVPAALDTSSDAIAPKDLLDLSRKASSTDHAAVLSLVAPPSNPVLRALPSLVHSDQGDLWVMYFAAPFAAAAAMGIVVAGHGP